MSKKNHTGEKPLLILKASAGSGKTYRLVEEFLKIILKEKSDTYYQSVLALTFTNKAAKEMKERIIEALEVLSKDPNEFGFDATFLNEKAEKLGLSPDKIREKSRACLNEIIHNYGNLSIMTIDKFSHKIVRAFARDLELESDFGIELDTNELKREVIAELIDSYGRDQELSNTLYNYSQSNIEEGSLWNVSQNLLKFSRTIDNEKFEPEMEKLRALNEDDFDRIQKELDVEIAKLQGSYDNLINEFYTYLETLSTDYDDYGQKKNGIYGNIQKKRGQSIVEVGTLLTKSTLAKMFDKQDFGRKQGLNGALVTANSAKICEYFEMHENFLEKQGGHFKVIKGIRSKIYNIRLIKRIQSTVDQIKVNKNIKEIGDLNKEIAQIILSESVPFIYERIGERYKHFLLDEFQDTSVMQWQNLVPLVENGISEDHKSLIVGDAKQSIYRFRNGEVEQFVQLPDLYNPRNSEIIERKRKYFKERGVEDPLQDNWRSRREIVEFNNQFFTEFALLMPEEYKEIYTENLKQFPKKSEGGYVQVKLKENFPEEEKVEQVLETIQSCFDDGFEPKDICIILRKKKKGVALAEALEKQQIPVISDESLFVSSDLEVQLLMALLALIEDSLTYEKQTLFAERYLQSKGLNTNTVIDYQYQQEKQRFLSMEQFLDDHQLPSLKSMRRFDSLVELVFWLKSAFDLSYEENPYLELFFEQVYQYEIQNAAYLKGFIDWWNEKGNQHAITIPESTNAIKLMTIHKSKGLQFPVVIIPNADWGFGDIGKNEKKDTLWVNQENGILNTFCIDTRNPDKEEDPELKAILLKEKNQMILDETNNLYVAFTRPIDRLYVFGELNFVKSQKGYDAEKISSSIYKTIGETEEYVFGTPSAHQQKNREEEHEVSLSQEVSGKQSVAFSFKPVYPNDSIQYNIDFGVHLHRLLAQIEKESDLALIDDYLAQEELSDSEKERLKESAHILLSKKEIKELLFENNVEVFSEQELISETGKLLRPDRVLMKKDKVLVVDFKTGKPRKKDEMQLQDYVKILEHMGSNNVEGKLIYIE